MGKQTLSLCLAILFARGAAAQTTDGPGPAAIQPVEIAAALSLAGRSDADRARDPQRRPDRVLAFMGIEKGMTVLDMFSGGGYYTEAIASAVGKSGTVVAQNNQAYLAFAKDEIETRYADNRLSNVQRIVAENNELDLPEARFDMAMLVLAYHDIYFVDEKNGWPKIDGEKMLAEIRAALKPGAVLGVVDHVAVAGAPAEVGGTLHRIDPERVKRELIAAGFVFEGESDVLHNAEDQHDKPMFDPSVRGKTDRFVYRFARP